LPEIDKKNREGITFGPLPNNQSIFRKFSYLFRVFRGFFRHSDFQVSYLEPALKRQLKQHYFRNTTRRISEKGRKPDGNPPGRGGNARAAKKVLDISDP
jgi:hypothetical protein